MSRPALYRFLVRHGGRPIDDVAIALRAAAEAGEGVWIEPRNTGGWSASHEHEISLYGILGRGATPVDAARDWLQAARLHAREPSSCATSRT